MTPRDPQHWPHTSTVELREYVEALFDQKDKALDAALAAQKEAVVKAEIATDRIAARAQADQEALREQMGERLTSLRRELESAVATQKEAVQKAETATEKRLTAMNEFRDALSDQSATMMPRREFEQAHNELLRQVAELRNRAGAFVPRNEVEQLNKEVIRQTGDLRADLSAMRTQIASQPEVRALERSSEYRGGKTAGAEGQRVEQRAITATQLALAGVGLTIVWIIVAVVSVIIATHP